MGNGFPFALVPVLKEAHVVGRRAPVESQIGRSPRQPFAMTQGVLFLRQELADSDSVMDGIGEYIDYAFMRFVCFCGCAYSYRLHRQIARLVRLWRLYT